MNENSIYFLQGFCDILMRDDNDNFYDHNNTYFKERFYILK